MKPLLCSLAVLFLVSCTTAPQTESLDFPILFARKSKVGQKLHLVSTSVDELSIQKRVAGTDLPPSKQSSTTEYIGDSTVLALTPKGYAQKARVTLSKMVRLSAGQSIELLPAGTVVMAERQGEQTTYSVSGRPVSAELAQALQGLGLSLHDDSATKDDKVFGTTERKKTGDSWPINAQAAAAGFTKSGIQADAKLISGTTTLEKVTKVDGKALLGITGTITFVDVQVPLPTGCKMESSVATMGHAGQFPVNPSKPVVEESTSIEIVFTYNATENGKPVVVTVSRKTTRQSQYSE